MRIEITPEIDDNGQEVFAWHVILENRPIGGGYCATRDDAINDAESFKLEMEYKLFGVKNLWT